MQSLVSKRREDSVRQLDSEGLFVLETLINNILFFVVSGSLARSVSNKLPCTFVDQSKKRPPPRSYIDALETRMQKMELLLDQIAPGVDFTDRIGPPVRLPDDRSNEDQPGGAPHLQASTSGSGMAQAAASPFGSPRSAIREHFPIKQEDGDSQEDSEDEIALVQTRISRTSLDGMSIEKAREVCCAPDIKGSKNVMTMSSALGIAHDDPQVRGSGLHSADASTSDAKSSLEDKHQFLGKASSFHIIPLLSRLHSSAESSATAKDQRTIAAESFRSDYWKDPSSSSHYPRGSLETILSVWPDPDLEEKLVSAYFTHVHRDHPFLNERVLREELKNPSLRSNFEWLGVSYGVFCCGARFIDDPRCLVQPAGVERDNPGECNRGAVW